MLITRESMLTGIVRTRDLDVNEEQLYQFERGGVMIQDAFPHLSATDREFILSGITEDEWDQAFAERPESEVDWDVDWDDGDGVPAF